SLLRLFPDVDPTTISSVLNHTLRARDLYLLDVRIGEVEPPLTFNPFTSSFEPSTRVFREYSTSDTIIFPLHTYFAILLAHNPDAHGLAAYFFSHLTHLQTLAADFAWDAVIEDQLS
ncbi:hypothetical protein C8J57DRAFT_1035272, partial [Mycena rebaudengoi]